MIGQVLKHPVFILSTLFLLIHQLLQKVFCISLPLIDAYLDDFFAMPFILSIFLAEQFYWQRRNTNLSILEILVFTLIFAIFFEEFLPPLNSNYTKDYWDYLMYALGSLFFYLTVNKKINTKMS